MHRYTTIVFPQNRRWIQYNHADKYGFILILGFLTLFTYAQHLGFMWEKIKAAVNILLDANWRPARIVYKK